MEGLKSMGRCGISEWERESPQPLEIGGKFLLDLALGIGEDSIERTANYSAMGKHLQAFVRAHSFRLLESLAYGLCRSLMLSFGQILEATLFVRKFPLRWQSEDTTFSVEVKMRRSLAVIGMGTNAGDLRENLKKASRAIGELALTTLVQASSIHRTAPLHYADQPDFLNQSLLLETLLSPWELWDGLQKIEGQMGRVRSRKNGPRTLDLDILLFEGVHHPLGPLILPHPRLPERRFAIEELEELGIRIPPKDESVMDQRCEREIF
jgi:2-amino-4-hydroxy-6-hydroxymethyldihydropteridine diphosphokinase/dihydroneopterin aldolase